MGRICSNFTQLQTRLLSFRRGIIPLKFMPRVTMAYCTHGIQSDFIYLSNTRSFTDLLRTPFPRLCDHHGNYRSIGWHQQQGRNLSSAPSLTDEAVRKEIEAITDKFMEAKEYLDDAVSITFRKTLVQKSGRALACCSLLPSNVSRCQSILL